MSCTLHFTLSVLGSEARSARKGGQVEGGDHGTHPAPEAFVAQPEAHDIAHRAARRQQRTATYIFVFRLSHFTHSLFSVRVRDMEEAEALAANLFMQPSVVRQTMDYLLSTHTPLDELGDGRQRTRLDELESDTRALVEALLRQPVDLELRAQIGVLSRDPLAKPRVQALLHWLGPALAVPDTVFVDAHFVEVVTLLAAMTAAPTRYWSNITQGGLIGHVVAQSFRFPQALAAAYSPVYMVVVMMEAQLDALAAHVDAGPLRVHGALHAAAIGAGLVSAATRVRQLAAADRALIVRLAAVLKGGGDFDAIRAQVKTLAANMHTLALSGYAATKARAVAAAAAANEESAI